MTNARATIASMIADLAPATAASNARAAANAAAIGDMGFSDVNTGNTGVTNTNTGTTGMNTGTTGGSPAQAGDIGISSGNYGDSSPDSIANGGMVGRYAQGGLGSLGGYSDGGRLLRGPGDGVSDSIPASIGDRQPARLANNEFVIPARIVSEIGNGSTDAGAKRLYQMMDRIQNARKKSMGKGKIAVDSKAYLHLPA
jgi:hypothetical protein